MKILFLFLTSLFFITNLSALEFLLDASEDNVIQKNLENFQEDFSEQKTIFKKLQEMAKRGDGLSQISLAKMYQKGINIKQDDELAFYWFQQASNLGYDKAQLIVAQALDKGVGVAKNSNQALDLYLKLAKKKNAQALYYLGKKYIDSPEMRDKGFEYVLFAAEKNYEPAQYLIAQIYHVGNSQFRDLKKAILWYQKSAKQGNVEAQYNLANFYYLGTSGQKSLTKAMQWYQKAAKQGHIRAQYSLGLRYLLGKGVDKDYHKAAKWLLTSARQGNAFAQYSIALRYALGQGVEKSQKEKIFWFKRAAIQNHLQSQYSLAIYYLSKGDKNLAMKYLKQAANAGHALAQKKLKTLTNKIDKVTITEEPRKIQKTTLPSKLIKNRQINQQFLDQFVSKKRQQKIDKKSNKKETKNEEIVSLLRKKALLGDVNAQNDLGVLYSKGNLISKDIKKALYWIEKAAKSGFIDALNNITVIYIVGDIVKTDYKKAYFYAKQSAQQGNEKGELLVEFLKERLAEE